MQSDDNHTSVSDLNTIYGPLLFDKIAPAQSEALLSYLISTCELIFL